MLSCCRKNAPVQPASMRLSYTCLIMSPTTSRCNRSGRGGLHKLVLRSGGLKTWSFPVAHVPHEISREEWILQRVLHCLFYTSHTKLRLEGWIAQRSSFPVTHFAHETAWRTVDFASGPSLYHTSHMKLPWEGLYKWSFPAVYFPAKTA